MDTNRKLDRRATALALATAVLAALALINVHQLWVYRPPTDGALWQRTSLGLQATAINRAQPSPLRRGDLVVAVNQTPVDTPEAVARQVWAAGAGHSLNYAVIRPSAGGAAQLLALSVPIRLQRPPLTRDAYLEIVGLLYLAMGLFVFYRRRSASQALRFYSFCLASFALYCFHFTGKLNAFDQVVFWINEAALLLAPCLLLHFALGFRRGAARTRRLRLLTGLLYVPAALLGLTEVALATGALWWPVTASASQALLDRASYLLFAAYFLAAALRFAQLSRRSGTRAAESLAAASDRQAHSQTSIMFWGTMLAIAPFLFLYVVPFFAGADLPRFASASVLSLLLVPLAFGYAIWRHQLLEAEIAFRRGVVYTLTTLAVVAVYWGVIALAGVLIHARLPTWGWAGWLLAILVTAVLFEPVKNRLQVSVDRLFYRDRYDFRRTLADFSRQLNAETDLDRLLASALERLARTLSLDRAAVYLDRADGAGFVLAHSHGLPLPASACDLSFLAARFSAPGATRLFLEHPAPAAAKLHYFLPCQVQERTVAVIGLGKTSLGEYLTGDDLALVETLAGHLAIAIENARLYATLRQRADEYQRLKDFNQNIVESIQVGVVATDLHGKVESWNAQMEVLTARPRHLALGHPLPALLGPEFAAEFARAASTGGIHSVPKFGLEGTRIVNLAIAPLVTARFEKVGHIVLINDVTAEAAMEQRLVQADRLRSVGLLAAGVAHEVNTPLAVISSYTQMLAKQTPAADPRAAVLDTITRQTFRASEIIANLLNFSRTGAARFGPVDLNTVLRDALVLVEHPLRSAGVHVISALHPQPVEIHGDAGQLQQVFLNLILNARDAMAMNTPGGGTLCVGTGVSGGDAWAAVSDSGAGIPADLQGRIFDPFFTTKSGHRSPESMSTGTGLGLAVTYGIVQEHGGAIQVHSQPGHGAEFRLTFPLLSDTNLVPDHDLAASAAQLIAND